MAPASYVAGQTNFIMVNGVDNYSGPSAANNEVPTGAIVTGIDIQGSVTNLVAISAYVWISIQQVRSGQSAISPRSAGGDPQRNQVFRQLTRMLGKDQNNNWHIKFRIPKKFQRVREGDNWILTVESDQINGENWQFIYKFYR